MSNHDTLLEPPKQHSLGPIYMGSAEEINSAFAFARRVGVKTLVGVPFKMVEIGYFRGIMDATR